MATWVRIDDELLRRVEAHADATGRSVSNLIDTALRDLLRREALAEAEDYELEWIVVDGGARPGVDVASRRSLYDVMSDES